jgi:hypothetical protein
MNTYILIKKKKKKKENPISSGRLVLITSYFRQNIKKGEWKRKEVCISSENGKSRHELV